VRPKKFTVARLPGDRVAMGGVDSCQVSPPYSTHFFIGEGGEVEKKWIASNRNFILVVLDIRFALIATRRLFREIYATSQPNFDKWLVAITLQGSIWVERVEMGEVTGQSGLHNESRYWVSP
jgi:hypothetical protein